MEVPFCWPVKSRVGVLSRKASNAHYNALVEFDQLCRGHAEKGSYLLGGCTGRLVEITGSAISSNIRYNCPFAIVGEKDPQLFFAVDSKKASKVIKWSTYNKNMLPKSEREVASKKSKKEKGGASSGAKAGSKSSGRKRKNFELNRSVIALSPIPEDARLSKRKEK